MPTTEDGVMNNEGILYNAVSMNNIGLSPRAHDTYNVALIIQYWLK